MKNKKKFFITFKNRKAEEIWAGAYDEAVKTAINLHGNSFVSVLPEDFPVQSDFLNKVNDDFKTTATSQERKGIIEYGQPLDPMDERYDWIDMARSEMVDGYKYLLAEEERRDQTLLKAFEEIDVIIAMNFENKKLESDLNNVKLTLKKMSKNI